MLSVCASDVKAGSCIPIATATLIAYDRPTFEPWHVMEEPVD
jgi:hypothetical protein